MKLEIEIPDRIADAAAEEMQWDITKGDKEKFIESYILQWLKSITISVEETKAANKAIIGIKEEIQKLGVTK